MRDPQRRPQPRLELHQQLLLPCLLGASSMGMEGGRRLEGGFVAEVDSAVRGAVADQLQVELVTN